MKRLLILFFPLWLEAASLYLPIDNPLMNDVEKMAVLTNMPTAKKPYSLKMIRQYNEYIKNTNPKLYVKIDTKINKLSKTFSKERITAAVTYGNGEHPIPNTHGKDNNSSYDLHAAYLLNLGEYAGLSLDLNTYEKNNETKTVYNNSYLSLGWDECQLDIGYRDHWFGPFKDSAMAISTNAVNSPSVTLSNSLPMPLNYEFFVSLLEEREHILYNNQLSPGSPYLAGVHLSFQIFDFVTLSANRMLQFGGGKRNIGDTLNALIDPSANDNTSSTLSTDNEVGNQIGSVTVQVNNQINNNIFSLYWSMGAEDTDYTQIYYFGNPSTSLGFFLVPDQGNISFRYEYNIQQNGWYIHHIYRDGYTNETNGIGHWNYDLKAPGDGVGSASHYISLQYELDGEHSFETQLRNIKMESYSSTNYSEGYDLNMIYTDATFLEQIKYYLRTGKTPLEEDYISAGVEFSL